MNDSAAKVICGPFGSRRLPVRRGVSHTSGRLTTCDAEALVRDAHMSDGVPALPAAGVSSLSHAHQLRDEDGIGLVVADVVVVGRACVVIERDEVAPRIQTAAHLERERRALGIPARFPRSSSTAREPADRSPLPETPPRTRHRLRPCGRTPEGPSIQTTRTSIARHVEKLRDAVAQPVGLHVVRIDRHLAVRRIGHRVSRRERGVPLERDVVFGLDDRGVRLPAPRRGSPCTTGRLLRGRRRAAHVA